MNAKTTTLLALLLTAPLALLAQSQVAPREADPVLLKGDPVPVARPVGSLAPTADQATAARLVYGLLSNSRYAYRPQALDDALSAQVLEGYLESLDAGRQFFTAADVAGFERYRAALDEAIKDGQLHPAYTIFDVYRARVGERIAFARGLLKADAFDFTADEEFRYDREDVPWAADAKALDALWTQSVRNDWLRLKLAGKKPEDIRRTLDRRYANLGTSITDLKGEDVFQMFLNAYANAIDPHTDYFTPRTADNFNMTMSLSLEGIGAVLQRQDDMVAIREIVPGGPASRSGKLTPGDRIVAVGQGASGAMEDVIGWRIDDVVAKIRGAKGTQVRLDVIAAEAPVDARPERVVLVRDRIRLEDQAAKLKVIDVPADATGPAKKIGVIKLPGFYQDFEARRQRREDYASATRDVARLLGELRAMKADGVVLDLRNNGGGSLDEAVELSGLFIDRGPVVQVRESGGRVTVNGDEQPGVAWDGPLAVLINRGSASASEIVAGAVQDYGRGLVIGETTFGKGTVQNMADLDRWPAREGARFGQVKMTIAQFFRVEGSSTQHRGIVPDIAFPVSVDATEFGESTYDNALPWTRIDAVEHVRYGNFAPLLPQLDARHDARVRADREFQWWKEDVAQFRAERAKKTISLNEAERRAERDRNEARRLARIAERKALGLSADPLDDDGADDGLQASERNIAAEAAREKRAEERPDPLLRESAAILADAVRLLNSDRQLSARVLPDAKSPGLWAD